MKTYWFIKFEISYKPIDATKRSGMVRGNSVMALESESFMPGTTIQVLKEWFRKTLTDHGSWNAQQGDIFVEIDFVIQTTEAGYLDFLDTTSQRPAHFATMWQDLLIGAKTCYDDLL